MTQPDMNEILARATEMQAQLQQAQQEIMAAQVTGSAGNGLVEVALTGSLELKSVKIDPQVVDPEDVDTLQDLIVGAYQDAHRKAGDLAQEKLGPLSQGQGNPFGGLM
ncbi:MAG TPA: YbaB/EbfC family nucleoid-associated protein [Corynebacterium sp.]|nr:YbaB/EbfC family nucleoid-associated protein [Corynebacterium sp.]